MAWVASRISPAASHRAGSLWPIPKGKALRIAFVIPVVFAAAYGIAAFVGYVHFDWGFNELMGMLSPTIEERQIAPALEPFIPAIFFAMGSFALALARRGTTPFSRLHGIGLLGSTTAIIVAECFGSRFKVGVVTSFLWIYAGVGIAAWRWPTTDSAEEQLPHKSSRTATRSGVASRRDARATAVSRSRSRGGDEHTA